MLWVQSPPIKSRTVFVTLISVAISRDYKIHSYIVSIDGAPSYYY